jgi:hypothetical protein
MEVLENTLNNNFMTPQKPSLIFGYWRPWNENSSLFNSYLDYVKDTSLVKYGADMVGQYIQSASKEQIASINKLGSELSYGLNVVSYLTLMNTSKTVGAIEKLENNTINELQKNREELTFINRKLDLQLEQQKLSNLLLQNISELLRVPDSEKERQLFIEKGIKHFVNASKNIDLYEDALKNLLKAEGLADDDYFVLHRIGCIYLYVEKYLDPQKALVYFKRASKYASVESDPKATRLVNVLSKASDENNFDENIISEKIGLLAADSYEKAAFASYILGDFGSAENYQKLAFEIISSIKEIYILPLKNQYQFTLAKYQIRNNNIDKAISNLETTINKNSIFYDLISNIIDLDISSNSFVVELLDRFDKNLKDSLSKLLERIELINSTKLSEKSKELSNITSFNLLKENLKNYETECMKLEIDKKNKLSKIDNYIKKNISEQKTTFTEREINEFSLELEACKKCSLEEMEGSFDLICKKIENLSYVYTQIPLFKNRLKKNIDKIKLSELIHFNEFEEYVVLSEKILLEPNSNVLIEKIKNKLDEFVKLNEKLIISDNKVVIKSSNNQKGFSHSLINLIEENRRLIEKYVSSIHDREILLEKLNNIINIPLEEQELEVFKINDEINALLKKIWQIKKEKNEIKNVPLNTKSDDKKSIKDTGNKKCFIATAAMGDEDHYIVYDFRKFRDIKLNNSFIGKFFITFYYLTSPPFAFIIRNISFIRNATAKYFIKPLHNIITKHIN